MTKNLKNHNLLNRLKSIRIVDGKEKIEKDTIMIDSSSAIRKITFEKLERLLIRNTENSILWNSYVLGRIYGIPENSCKHLIEYVAPLGILFDNRYDSPQELLKHSYIYDVKRLKEDKLYMPRYQAIEFVRTDKSLG